MGRFLEIPDKIIGFFNLPSIAVAVATGYGLDAREVGVRILVESIIFTFSISARPALGPAQSFIQWVTGALSPGVQQPEREADLSPPSTLVERMWIFTFTPPYVFMA
jgi:hypothetical protein